MAKRKNAGDSAVRGRPIDFLGYQFFKEKTLMRKSTKQRFARKIKNLKSEKRIKETKASYWGWSIHADCRNLWNKLTRNDMSFLDKGIRQRAQNKDGQKFFDVETKKLMDIINIPITIVDFQEGIKTREGEGRYCVLFEKDGQRMKFITNSYNIKDILDQARELEENGQKIFPVENVIVKRKPIGNGGSAFYFDE